MRKNKKDKLTLAQVEEIRNSTVSSRKLAPKYNVSKSAINYVRNGLTYKLTTPKR